MKNGTFLYCYSHRFSYTTHLCVSKIMINRYFFAWKLGFSYQGAMLSSKLTWRANFFLVERSVLCCSGIGTDFVQPSSIKVTLGQHDLTQTTGRAYEMSITSISIHPGYKCSKPRNDIAIIHLEEHIGWSEFVTPACLPTSSDQTGYRKFDNVLATVAGWGWTNEQSGKGKSCSSRPCCEG